MAQFPQHVGVRVVGKSLSSLMYPTLHRCVICKLERFQCCASCPGALAGLGLGDGLDGANADAACTAMERNSFLLDIIL